MCKDSCNYIYNSTSLQHQFFLFSVHVARTAFISLVAVPVWKKPTVHKCCKQQNTVLMGVIEIHLEVHRQHYNYRAFVTKITAWIPRSDITKVQVSLYRIIRIIYSSWQASSTSKLQYLLWSQNMLVLFPASCHCADSGSVFLVCS